MSRLSRFCKMMDRVISDRHQSACVQERLEPRRLLSGSFADPINLGLLEGTASFADSVDARANPADYRSITLATPGNLSVALLGLSANADLALIHDANHNGRIDRGEVLGSSAHPGTSPEFISQFLAAGTYLIGVYAAAGAKTGYRLTVATDFAGQSIFKARNIGTLAASASFRDFVGASDPSDYYRFTLSSDKTLSASIGGASSPVSIQLIRDANQDGAAQPDEVLRSTTGSNGSTLVQSLTAGTYFFRVLPAARDTNYTLALKATDPPATGLKIIFNYNFDSSGFFASHPDAMARLQDAATYFTRITDHLSALQSGNGNTWSETFLDPSTGRQRMVNNPTVAAGTLVIYVGGTSTLHSLELGQAGSGGYTATGSEDWLNAVESRGQSGALDDIPTDFGPWGGSIGFSTLAKWNLSIANPQPNQNDFLSVAIHEIGHLLGIGTSDSWFAQVVNHDFIGRHAEQLFGRPVPLVAGDDHWNNVFSRTSTGVTQAAEMDPTLAVGQRKFFTDLDYAGLQDIGWQISG